MFESVSPEQFRTIFTIARHWNQKIADATSDYSHEAGTRYFLDEGDIATRGISGYAVRADGELVFVFSVSSAGGNGARIVTSAIENGATHLDCFDGYLVNLYSRHGFQRVTSLDNWTPGGPDVVFMALPNHFLAALGKAEAVLS